MTAVLLNFSVRWNKKAKWQIVSTQEAGAVIEWNYLKRTGTERWMHPIIDTT